jgi:hypothetical protein
MQAERLFALTKGSKAQIHPDPAFHSEMLCQPFVSILQFTLSAAANASFFIVAEAFFVPRAPIPKIDSLS